MNIHSAMEIHIFGKEAAMSNGSTIFEALPFCTAKGPKQIQSTNYQIRNQVAPSVLNFEIQNLNLFKISSFGFRASARLNK
jgi:hypothetical protein